MYAVIREAKSLKQLKGSICHARIVSKREDRLQATKEAEELKKLEPEWHFYVVRCNITRNGAKR